MLEFLKLITDIFVLRDLKQKGEYSGNAMLLGFGYVIFLFATVFPAALLSISHPRYSWVFFTAVAVNVVALIYVLILGTRWQRRAKADLNAQSASTTATPE
jgi:hypothetical protein